MKRMRNLAFAVIALMSFNLANASNADLSSEAVAYLNNIGKHYKDIAKKTWDYTSAVAKNKSARKIEKRRSALIEELNVAIREVKKTKPFEGDASFRDSVLSFLNLYRSVLLEDYAQVADLEAVAEDSYDLMEAYLKVLDIASEKLTTAQENLEEQQNIFAAKHGVTIEEGEETKLARRLNQASRMWAYHNEVFLIFFKAHKQEVYFLEAAQRGDVNAMEQNREVLAAFSAEGLEKLKSIRPFDGDNTLVIACKEMLQFYKTEAEKDIPVLLEFYVTKEHFEDVKTSFERLSKKEKTQEAVDEFNKAVNDYNANIGKFNATNERLNKERSKRIDNWNKTTSRFTSKNVK